MLSYTHTFLFIYCNLNQVGHSLHSLFIYLDYSKLFHPTACSSHQAKIINNKPWLEWVNRLNEGSALIWWEGYTYQAGVDGRGVGAVRKVIGVVLTGGGRCCCVWRAVHPERGVELSPRTSQQSVLIGGAAEGGCGLRRARSFCHRPGNRIAASRTGVCRHEKLHEENRG